jgi:hypothetical protein
MGRVLSILKYRLSLAAVSGQRRHKHPMKSYGVCSYICVLVNSCSALRGSDRFTATYRFARDLAPANTTNAATRLIEEGALFSESVRSESEPWTSFYMAGEIIRELRKAHDNKQVSVPATKDDMRKAA